LKNNLSIIIFKGVKNMKELKFRSVGEKVKTVRKLILSQGNQIGSVWFVKRSDGKLRKMSYRLHVTEPKYSPKPTGKMRYRKTQDSNNNLLTVFDTNFVRYNNRSKMCGRGGYKCVPLDSVIRVKVGGTIYRM
jgi:hypothetical protein